MWYSPGYVDENYFDFFLGYITGGFVGARGTLTACRPHGINANSPLMKACENSADPGLGDTQRSGTNLLDYD